MDCNYKKTVKAGSSRKILEKHICYTRINTVLLQRQILWLPGFEHLKP